MDIGLVCDQCDTFNPMTSQVCVACGIPLSLGQRRDGKSAQRPAAGAAVGTAGQPSTRRPAVAPIQAPAAAAGGTSPRAPNPVADVSAQGTSPRNANPAAPARRLSTPVAAPATAAPLPKPPEVPAAPAFQRNCHECGAPLQQGFKFCGKCGGKVEYEHTATAAPPYTGPGPSERKTLFFGQMQAARAKLVLIKGDGLDGLSYTLAGQDHVAGRVDGPLLFREDPYLSPRHANFFYKDGKLHVRDEGSANGIFIRIRAPMPVRSGDTFLVGEQVIKVETTPPEMAGLGPDEDGTYYFASPRRTSKLRLVQLLRGGDIGLVFRAAGDAVTIGREANDVNFPEDPFISGRHAQVSFSDAGLMLTDLGSKNGTFLRITGEMSLQHGDYVFMGQQLLRVEIV